MRNTYLIASLLGLVAAHAASAQTANQTVTFQVDAINVIAVAGAPSLSVSTAVAGTQPTAASSIGTTWSVTTNQSGAKITASLDLAMPAGLTLTANLSAPAGATSTGAVALGVAAVDVVTGITTIASPGLGLTYQLSATAAAGVIASTSRVVTYTITGGI
jgi:hypothetical protein